MTSLTLLVAGLLLGLAGSGHCAVMCGPLALAFGRRNDASASGALRHTLIYHAGRLSAYLAAGLIAGLMGRTLANVGFGRGLAVTLGALLIAGAVSGRVNRVLGQPLWSAMGARLSAGAIRWGRSHPVAGPSLMGAANGLLPCGLMYAAVVAAAGLGGVGDALLFIGGFGLGTIPALFAVTSMASWMPGRARRIVARATPLIMASIGVLLIARGAMGEQHNHRPAFEAPASTASTPSTHAHLR